MLKNKKNIFFIFVIILSGILFYNILSDSNSIHEIKLEKSFIINEEQDTLLYKAEDICGVTNSFILVTDIVDYRIKKFLENGSLAASFGQKGGCSECFNSGPAYITLNQDGSKIAIVDYLSPVIKIFDNQYNYIEKIDLQAPINDLIFDKYGNLITARPPIMNLGNAISLIKLDGKIINSFDPVNLTGNMVLDMFQLSYLRSRDYIVIMYYYRNLIQIYKTDGKLVREISIPNINDMAPLTELSNMRDFNEKLPAERLLNCFNTNSKDKIFIVTGANKTEILALNINGDILGHSFVKEEIRGIYVDNLNNIYLIQNGGATIGKYILQL